MRRVGLRPLGPVVERAARRGGVLEPGDACAAERLGAQPGERRALAVGRGRADRQHQRRRPLARTLDQRRPHRRRHGLRLVDQGDGRVEPLQPVDRRRQREQLAAVPRAQGASVAARLEDPHPGGELGLEGHHPLDRAPQGGLHRQPVVADERNLRRVVAVAQRPQRDGGPQRRLGVAPRDLQPADAHPVGEHRLDLDALEGVQPDRPTGERTRRHAAVRLDPADAPGGAVAGAPPLPRRHPGVEPDGTAAERLPVGDGRGGHDRETLAARNLSGDLPKRETWVFPRPLRPASIRPRLSGGGSGWDVETPESNT